MCGLCGGRFAPRAPGEESARALVQRMADIQRHRGPDDEGFQEAGDIVLGFRRLSIIDLDSGHQPISNEDGSVWVILNGEIYNYRELADGLVARGHTFKSHGDSEVIAHLYEEKGERVFEDLNGMFTIAVLDVRRRRLVLARDRAGVKPLYYARCGRDFAFASEIKALLEHPGCPRSLDERQLAPYLATQYVPGPRTLFAGVRSLPPGSRLIVDEGKEPIEESYWRLPSLDPAHLYQDREAATRDVAALVREAVRMRLVSDVPLGALLSGGLDSSIVVGVMAEHATGPVLTVCVGYEGGGAMDEREKARDVAKHFGTQHHEIVLGVREALELLPRLVWHNELPVAEPLIVASYALFREARRHVTVVLSGEGADELFGGYRRYRALSELARWRSLLPPASWAGWAAMKGGRGPWADLGKVGQAAAQALPAEALWEWQSVFSRRELGRLLARPDLASASGPLVYRTVDGFRDDLPTEEMSNQLMGIEIQNRLVDFILGRADKMSMANSLELRTPFLDYRLIEMSRAIPARWKLSATGEKLILREAFRDLLPERARRRGKQAFQSPYASWLPHLSSALVPESRLVKDGWIARSGLEILRAHWPRSERRAKQLWTVLLLEMWYRLFLTREEIPALGRAAGRATPEPVR